MKPPANEAIDDAVVFRVAQLFIGERDAGLSPTAIAEQVSREFPRHRALTRETIYPMIGEAVRRGFIRLVPPVDQHLAERCQRPDTRTCSPAPCAWSKPRGPHDNAKVAAVAAELALDHLADIMKAQTRARWSGVGLGPGRATLDFCRAFGSLLAGYPGAGEAEAGRDLGRLPGQRPGIRLHQLLQPVPASTWWTARSGCSPRRWCPSKDFEEIKQRAGVKEAFAARESIDLVVTSMGDVRDEHDLLSMFLRQSGQDLDRLRAAGWIGNVQYRPYSPPAR